MRERGEEEEERERDVASDRSRRERGRIWVKREGERLGVKDLEERKISGDPW